MKALAAVTIFLGLFASLRADKLKICSTLSDYNQCLTLQRGNSEVSCQYAQDAIECAKRIQNETADFGAISAESALQLAVLGWEDIAVVKEIRHKQRQRQAYDFSTVALVRKDISSFDGLKNRRYCHPGLYYSKGDKWTEYVTKYFERNISLPICQGDMSAAEIEVSSLNNFFAKTCRPGTWSFDPKEDAYLKKKYSNLCALCPSGCSYGKSKDTIGNEFAHGGALDCLYKDGDVTYVSKSDAIGYFKEGNGDDFRYLCPNNTIQPVVNNDDPCVWLKQPWGVVISAYKSRENIETTLNKIQLENANSEWKQAVLTMLSGSDDHLLVAVAKDTIENYIGKNRPIPSANAYCNTEISWCTRNSDEKDECDVIRAGGISSGVLPLIVCHNPVQNGTIDCMNNINKNTSKFMGIDSNYGYIARDIFNLESALYFETEENQYSRAVVVIRSESKYTSLKSLKGAQACLPEFGGITSVAFVNAGKKQRFLNRKECRYGKLMENFFGTSCAPGAQDVKHFFTKDDGPANLCGLCLKTDFNHPYINVTDDMNVNPAPTCEPNKNNRYFGNAGALRCLQEQGDVAILEQQSLSDIAQREGINESDFRIICRNGSLAKDTGFSVDEDCMLTSIVDGEIVVRRGTKHEGVVHTLTALDKYFRTQLDFKMYNIYNGEKNLLFKDSTIGLVPADSDVKGEYVKNYVNLFEDIDRCNGAHPLQFSAFTIILFGIFASLF